MPKLLGAAYALIIVGWMFANPPGAAPDEPSNYIKAVALGLGQLGTPATVPPAYAARYGFDGPRAATVNLTTRAVDIPPALAPSRFGCNAFRPLVSAACLYGPPIGPTGSRQLTFHGTYQPYLFGLPALLTRLGSDASSALLLGRVGMAVLSFLLLQLGVWVLARGGDPRRLLGILVSVTPMVMFVSGSLSASGPEICGGIAFFAALLCVARSEVDRTVWLVTALAGSVLAMSRPLGVAWVGLGLLFLVCLLGARPTLAVVRAGKWSRIAVTSLVVATALSLGWEVTMQPPHHTTLGAVLGFIPAAAAGLSQVLIEQVGVFGWLEVWMPLSVYMLWGLMLVTLVALAWFAGTPRQRLALALLVSVNLVVIVMVGASILSPLGLPVQGRHVLAFSVAVALWAGEVCHLNRQRFTRVALVRVLPYFAALSAVVQAMAWYVNAHRQAVGIGGPLAFLGRSEWAPPLGWWPWLLIVLAGSGALLVWGGLSATRWRQRAGTEASRLAPAA
jgi:hypothetical protein